MTNDRDVISVIFASRINWPAEDHHGDGAFPTASGEVCLFDLVK